MSVQRLLKILGYPPPIEVINPQNALLPVADPEVAFNWTGYTSNAQNTAPTNNQVQAKITIPEDGFYCLDAAAVGMIITGAVETMHRLILELVDGSAAANQLWYLLYGWSGAAGNISSAIPVTIATIRFFLKATWIIQWRSGDAWGLNDVASTSIALRRLYQA